MEFSQIESIPSRSFCKYGGYMRFQDNYLNLSRDLGKLDDRWIYAKKVTLQNLVNRIKGFTQELSIKCARY